MSQVQPDISQSSLFDLYAKVIDEDSARSYLEAVRWPDGIVCIKCGHPEIWKIRAGKIYTCRRCREQFNVRTGTALQGSKISLQKWVLAMYLMTVSEKSISTTQLSKELGITQKSAWNIASRIKEWCGFGGVNTEGLKIFEINREPHAYGNSTNPRIRTRPTASTSRTVNPN